MLNYMTIFHHSPLIPASFEGSAVVSKTLNLFRIASPSLPPPKSG